MSLTAIVIICLIVVALGLLARRSSKQRADGGSDTGRHYFAGDTSAAESRGAAAFVDKPTGTGHDGLTFAQISDLENLRAQGRAGQDSFEQAMEAANRALREAGADPIPYDHASDTQSDEEEIDMDEPIYASIFDSGASFYLAGATFSNRDGSSRQDTLKAIAQSKSHKAKATFIVGEYQGLPTVEVWSKSKQIGFAPKEQVPEMLEFLDGGEYTARVSAFGGDDGKPYTGKIEYVRTLDY